MVAQNELLIAAPGEPIVNVTAYTARQKVGGYIGGSVSHMMGGDEPSLVWSVGRLVWRVPIQLTSPRRGLLGIIGTLDVDARTGQLVVTPEIIDQIQTNAQSLIADPTSTTTE